MSWSDGSPSRITATQPSMLGRIEELQAYNLQIQQLEDLQLLRLRRARQAALQGLDGRLAVHSQIEEAKHPSSSSSSRAMATPRRRPCSCSPSQTEHVKRTAGLLEAATVAASSERRRLAKVKELLESDAKRAARLCRDRAEAWATKLATATALETEFETKVRETLLQEDRSHQFRLSRIQKLARSLELESGALAENRLRQASEARRRDLTLRQERRLTTAAEELRRVTRQATCSRLAAEAARKEVQVLHNPKQSSILHTPGTFKPLAHQHSARSQASNPDKLNEELRDRLLTWKNQIESEANEISQASWLESKEVLSRCAEEQATLAHLEMQISKVASHSKGELSAMKASSLLEGHFRSQTKTVEDRLRILQERELDQLLNRQEAQEVQLHHASELLEETNASFLSDLQAAQLTIEEDIIAQADLEYELIQQDREQEWQSQLAIVEAERAAAIRSARALAEKEHYLRLATAEKVRQLTNELRCDEDSVAATTSGGLRRELGPSFNAVCEDPLSSSSNSRHVPSTTASLTSFGMQSTNVSTTISSSPLMTDIDRYPVEESQEMQRSFDEELPPILAAAVNAVRQYGWTAIHCDGEWTALHWAASEGRDSLCAELLDLGADPNFRDNQGRTAIECAREANNASTLLVLLRGLTDSDWSTGASKDYHQMAHT